MKALDSQQADVLREVCNIGMSKAAKQLSILLNGPVTLGNIKISIVNFDDPIWDINADILSMVCQRLTQDVSGYAALFLKRDYSHVLSSQMLGCLPSRLSEEEIRSCEQEAVLEIGNVLISSCATAIVDMLKKSVGLTQPNYSEGTIKDLVGDLLKNKLDNESDLIVIATTMSTTTGNFSGKLLLCMSNDTIERILESINQILS